jgi:hypothetical protein
MKPVMRIDLNLAQFYSLNDFSETILKIVKDYYNNLYYDNESMAVKLTFTNGLINKTIFLAYPYIDNLKDLPFINY